MIYPKKLCPKKVYLKTFVPKTAYLKNRFIRKMTEPRKMTISKKVSANLTADTRILITWQAPPASLRRPEFDPAISFWPRALWRANARG
jgi:hypothetical protein